MLDLSVSRKNKINLADYDYHLDIKNRISMSLFNRQDIEVLEEILYGSIRIPLVKLSKNLDVSEEQLLDILQKLSQTGLFILEKDAIVVDKDMRKYFDCQMMKFDEDFKPNMGFIQGFLRKVPIHTLPIWYAVPRSSNNIFASLIERYFKTPQIYKRYLLDLNLNEPVMAEIVAELFESESLQLSVDMLLKKYKLEREVFEEYMLHLEFNFVCCLQYVPNGDSFDQVIVPFYEWASFLKFKQRHTPQPIPESVKITKYSSGAFHFIKDMTHVLEEVVHASKLPLEPAASESDFIFSQELVNQLLVGCKKQNVSQMDQKHWQHYLSRIVSRLARLGLVIRTGDSLSAHHQVAQWLNMEIEDKALYLYRHPQNRTLKMGFDPKLDTEKNVREVEKGLERIKTPGWFYIEDFLNGMLCSVGENEAVSLHKEGPHWSYRLPKHGPEEKLFMRYVIMQRLFEVGMVDVGIAQNKDCFKLYPFGSDTLC